MNALMCARCEPSGVECYHSVCMRSSGTSIYCSANHYRAPRRPRSAARRSATTSSRACARAAPSAGTRTTSAPSSMATRAAQPPPANRASTSCGAAAASFDSAHCFHDTLSRCRHGAGEDCVARAVPQPQHCLVQSSVAMTKGLLMTCSGKCGRGKSCRYSHDLPLPNPGCWPVGVPMPPGMMSTFPPSLPQSLPMLQVPGKAALVPFRAFPCWRHLSAEAQFCKTCLTTSGVQTCSSDTACTSMQGGLAPMGMPGIAVLPPHINALR